MRITLWFSLFALDTNYAARKNTPTMGEYFLEAIILLGRDNWRYFLPNDTDIDQDGSVSDIEIQKKFHLYLGLLFKMTDQDDNNIITEEEMTHLNFEIDGLTNKVIDIAMGSFPLKPILRAVDVNKDGFYDEDDFYLPGPAQLAWERPKTNESDFFLEDGKLPVYETLSGSEYNNNNQVVLLEELAASVLCKSLGFEGLEEMVAPEFVGHMDNDRRYVRSRQRVECQGGESRLEDCKMIRMNESMQANRVRCRGEQKLVGSLHLVGGKDDSAGDIIFGNKGLGCLPQGPRAHQFSEMICRQLGFAGFIRTTRWAAFTINMRPRYQDILQTGISCNGTEKDITDCKLSKENQSCENLYGIICKTDTRKGIDESILADIAKGVGWNLDFSDMWEKFGRLLFIADINNDGKLTEDELAETAKKYMSGILNFLDQNQDGHISIDDINTINLQVGPIHKVLDLAFDVFANKNNDDINLYFPTISGIYLHKVLNLAFNVFANKSNNDNNVYFRTKIAGIYLPELFRNFYPENYDQNDDRILNALDFYRHSGDRSMSRADMKLSYLLPLLNLKLDKNQDGRLHRQELRQFVEEMFKQLDTDNNGAFTLEDVTRLMRKYGFDCFQAAVFKTYLTITFYRAKNQFEESMVYLFKQLDLDDDRQVTIEEFEKMHVPCSGFGPPLARRPGQQEDNYNPRDCYEFLAGFYGAYGAVRFPNLDQIYQKSSGSGRRDESEGEEAEDYLTNAACDIIMQ